LLPTAQVLARLAILAGHVSSFRTENVRKFIQLGVVQRAFVVKIAFIAKIEYSNGIIVGLFIHYIHMHVKYG